MKGNYSSCSSGGFSYDVDVDDPKEFNSKFWSAAFQSVQISLSPHNLQEFKQEWGIKKIYEAWYGPCGRGIWTIKDDIFKYRWQI